MTSSSLNSLDTFFEQNLAVSLELDAEGDTSKILSGNIERIYLSMHSYGFNCSVQFSGFDDDELDSLFTSPKVTTVTLSFKSTEPTHESDPPLLELKGIVTDKCFKRVDSVLGGETKPIRLYEVFFSDNAAVTWGQHFPVNVYVDESMKDVIEKHKNPEVAIKYDFGVLDKKHPIIAFSLPYKDWLAEKHQVSFYSFLMWYLQQENGIWSYDYKAHSYLIEGKKDQGKGDPYKVHEWWVNPPVCIFPRIARFNTKIIKHSSDTFDGEDKENKNPYKSVRRESITSTNYTTFPEHAYETVHSILNSEKNETEIEIIKFKDDFHIDKLVPGAMISFVGDIKATWCNDPTYKDKVFRVRNLVLDANKIQTSETIEKPIQTYRLYVKGLLEYKEEVFVERPQYIPPAFPFSIQGKIFSDIGDKEQSTYKISESEQAPQGQYLVTLPLAGEEKKVVVPFTPDLMSGQYYFPFCKGEKVLLSMYFRTAKIQRIIDWQPLARLPTGVQGNQLVMASNGKDKYTIIRHEFEDGKDSVFTIKQSSSETQTQTVRIKEKDILITIDEKDKKTLLVHLNNDSGLTLSLDDKTASMTQQTVFDGKAMTHTCKGSDGTSTCIQKPDSITFSCKTFSVSSDKIILDAKESINQTGKSKVNIETQTANINASIVKLGA